MAFCKNCECFFTLFPHALDSAQIWNFHRLLVQCVYLDAKGKQIIHWGSLIITANDTPFKQPTCESFSSLRHVKQIWLEKLKNRPFNLFVHIFDNSDPPFYSDYLIPHLKSWRVSIPNPDEYIPIINIVELHEITVIIMTLSYRDVTFDYHTCDPQYFVSQTSYRISDDCSDSCNSQRNWTKTIKCVSEWNMIM